MQKHIIKIFIIFLLSLTLISASSPKVQQFNPSRLQQAIKTNEFTLVYFYSSSCQYCQIFTPKFEQFAKIHNISGLVLGKIDGPGYPVVTQKYGIYSYPSVAIFWKDIDAPLFFRQEREISKLLQFVRFHTRALDFKVTKEQLQKLTQEQKNMGILYVGPIPSFELNITSVLSYLQPYRSFAIFDANVTQPYLQIKGKHYTNFDANELQKIIRVAFAQVHDIDEQGWLNMHVKKQTGIVYLDLNNDKNVVKILEKLAPEFPDIVFMKIDPSQDQFKQAIDTLGVQNEESLFGVEQKHKAKFLASKPYTQQSIRQFIHKVINLTAPLYLRSQKTTHKQKLTRNNFEEKVMKEPKDVVVFIYRDEDRLQAKFMDLFKFLSEKLKNNQNLSLLRCNLSKNQIEQKLGFEVKTTPTMVFYAHRMKDRPAHYLNSVISAENVLEFIMENTTFDWEDEWGEL